MFENRQVRTTPRQPEQAPVGSKPNSVLNLARVTYLAVQFTDADNNIKSTTLVCVGGQYYEPPNAEDWTNKLLPVKDWLQKALVARDQSATSIPNTDVVDVVA